MSDDFYLCGLERHEENTRLPLPSWSMCPSGLLCLVQIPELQLEVQLLSAPLHRYPAAGPVFTPYPLLLLLFSYPL